MLTCLWQTVQDWATLTAQPEAIFMDAVSSAGTTYVRICADGTVWMTETLALTIVGVQP